jgi:hypothetical protein
MYSCAGCGLDAAHAYSDARQEFVDQGKPAVTPTTARFPPGSRPPHCGYETS